MTWSVPEEVFDNGSCGFFAGIVNACKVEANFSLQLFVVAEGDEVKQRVEQLPENKDVLPRFQQLWWK